MLAYMLPEDFDGPVTLTVTDARGDTARTFSSEENTGPSLGAFAALAELFGLGGGSGLLPKTPGLHRVNWDMRYPAPELPQGTVIFGTLGQPPAVPGEYTVTMAAGDVTTSRTFRVLPDPRTDVTPAQYVAQQEFLDEVGGLIEVLADDAADLRSVRGQVEGIAGVVGDAGLSEADAARVAEAAEELGGKLTAVEEEMLQTDNRSFYDPLRNPGKLAAELAYVYNNVAGGFGGVVNAPPTDQAVERKNELLGEVNELSGRLDEVLQQDLADFNDLIRSLGLEPVVRKEDRRLVS